MSDPLDRLFKDKLTDHSREPSPQAWNKVRDRLSKKNRAPVMRIAAGVLLAGLLVTFLVWTTSRDAQTGTPALTKSETSQPQLKPEEKKQKTPLAYKERVKASQVPPSTQRKQSVINPPRVMQPANEEMHLVSESMPNKEPVKIETIIPQMPVQPVAQSEKPTVIEFRLDAVKEPPAKQEIAAAEKSRIRRVVEFAREAKNGESPLNLRQKKDDIFALNFIKDKQKNNK